MGNEFTNYKQSLRLKELGFNEPCFKYIYTGDTGINVDHYLDVEPSKAKDYNAMNLCISQPTFSQAFRFFRKNYYLFCGILTECSYGSELHVYHITGVNQGDISKGDFYTYEEAESACLDKLIEIVGSKSE